MSSLRYNDESDEQDILFEGDEGESRPLLDTGPQPHVTTEYSLRNDSLLNNYTFASKFEQQQQQRTQQQRSVLRGNASTGQSAQQPLFFNNVNISYDSQESVSSYHS
jgi:hypothetical protein